jgi:hypothetical protein
MPDGVLVDFPDDMPKGKIRDLIKKKFPDAAGHYDLAGQVGKGIAQGAASSIMDVESILPKVPFLSGELPGLPESALKARRGATREAEKFVNEPSEGMAQSTGKFVGGTLPYALAGPTGLAGLAMQGAGKATIGAVPFAIHAAVHILGHKLRVPHALRTVVSDFIRSHPAVINAMQQARPVAGAIGGAIGQSAESRALPAAAGIRATTREPEAPNEQP